MSEPRFRLDYDLLWNNYYQVIELDDGDTDYLRRLSPTEIIKRLNEQQATITELKNIINFASNEGDLIVLLMKEIIKLRQEVQECRAYETIEKGVSNYD